MVRLAPPGEISPFDIFLECVLTDFLVLTLPYVLYMELNIGKNTGLLCKIPCLHVLIFCSFMNKAFTAKAVVVCVM